MNLSLHTYSDLKVFQDEIHTTIIYTKEGSNLRQRNPSTTCNQTSTQSRPNSIEFHQTQLSTFSFVSFSEVHNSMVSHDQFSCQSNTQLPCQNSTVYHVQTQQRFSPYKIQSQYRHSMFIYFSQFPCFLRIFFPEHSSSSKEKQKEKKKEEKYKKEKRKILISVSHCLNYICKWYSVRLVMHHALPP